VSLGSARRCTGRVRKPPRPRGRARWPSVTPRSIAEEPLRVDGGLWGQRRAASAALGMLPLMDQATRDRSPRGLLTSPEAAAVLGVGPRRARQLAEAGVLRPAIVTPWGRLFERTEVERLAAERGASRPPEPVNTNDGPRSRRSQQEAHPSRDRPQKPSA